MSIYYMYDNTVNIDLVLLVSYKFICKLHGYTVHQ